jgi:class 3 adenylate cyclase
MPTFMDRHDNVDATDADVAALHALDVAQQERHGVKYLSYWHDLEAHSVFCFVDAPTREAAEAVHAEAHGAIASKIIQVEGMSVAGFLGPQPTESSADSGNSGTAFRTILFTDIVDSTALTQRLGDLAAMDLVRAHDQIVRVALTETYGSEVKHTGDGIMAAFESVPMAVSAAVKIQRRLARYSEDAEHPLQVRIGLSAGEPVTEHNDLFGSAVQLAARACAIADPNGIYVSEHVRERYDGVEVQFEMRGPFELKGFSDPVSLYEVCWGSESSADA